MPEFRSRWLDFPVETRTDRGAKSATSPLPPPSGTSGTPLLARLQQNMTAPESPVRSDHPGANNPGCGCERHTVTPEDYARRWESAYRADTPDLAVCRCCGGPTANSGTYLCRPCSVECPECGFVGGLVEHAAHLAPVVRLSVRETDDGGDIALLRRLRAILSEYPGGNRVVVTLRLKDGRRVEAEWAALASRELRLALGRALARHARESAP